MRGVLRHALSNCSLFGRAQERIGFERRIRALLLQRLQREAQHGDCHRGDAQHPAEVIELHAVVGSRRVMDAEQDDEDQHRRPNGSLFQIQYDIADCHHGERAGNFVRIATEEGVDRVAAV